MPSYLTKCNSCHRTTSRSYARNNNGNCKLCSEGVSGGAAYKCPDCGGPLSAYQHAHHYHCDSCTRQADPVGWANEVNGMYDGPDY